MISLLPANLNFKSLYIICGIFVSFGLYGTMQEKLFKGTFGENEKFTYVMPSICIANIVTWFYGVGVKTLNPYNVEKPIPTWINALLGLLQVLAMSSSFMALQWVSYPAQVLAKSCKPIPVLFMGVLLGAKSYNWKKYVTVCLIVFGVTSFFYNSDKASGSSFGIGVGELLLLCSLLTDGIMNSFQERVMQKYKPHSNYFMMETNKWVIVITFLLSLFSGDAKECFKFIQRFPSCISLILLMSFCSALGQFFIYKGLTELGTLSVSLITTTRKFFTVVASVIIFGHHFSSRQWFAVVLVFSGLTLDSYLGKSAKNK